MPFIRLKNINSFYYLDFTDLICDNLFDIYYKMKRESRENRELSP